MQDGPGLVTSSDRTLMDPGSTNNLKQIQLLRQDSEKSGGEEKHRTYRTLGTDRLIRQATDSLGVMKILPHRRPCPGRWPEGHGPGPASLQADDWESSFNACHVRARARAREQVGGHLPIPNLLQG